MPLLTSRIPDLKASGPVIEVLISVSSSFRKLLEEQHQTIPLPYKKIMLIDTGASVSAIKSGIASQLGLTPHGTVNISTASHSSISCPTFDVDLIFPLQNVIVPNVRVFESSFEGQNLDGLIARDVLASGLLIYSGYENSFTLGF